MKWFEVSIDHGDGSTGVCRARTKKALEKHISDQGEEPGCYPWGDIEEVDTESKYFFVEDRNK